MLNDSPSQNNPGQSIKKTEDLTVNLKFQNKNYLFQKTKATVKQQFFPKWIFKKH